MLSTGSQRSIADPLGLLGLFSGTFSPDTSGMLNADGTWNTSHSTIEASDNPWETTKKSDAVMDKVKEHIDDFKRESVRRRWEQARSSMHKKRAQENNTLDPPPPLYRSTRFVWTTAPSQL